ncbi:SDR family oxidoreductase [Sphingomonas psychrotolerans]|uniref:Short-chain dehydrogenase n=1 Tax=Sphingomonas psychrotolerans TaxID=1327635 RepID=A0A2K8MM28_9SPHN|nr:SDR family oxidoreductase [Sphingomonas psychrotolerans]ATY32281.1 short-chain dehydrogenase [Sphingomonas psychrotolerans]
MSQLAEPPVRDETDAHTGQPGLAGRKAIVTGGTTGIGRAIAILLAAEGAKVFVCGRTPTHLDDALARIREVGDGDGLSLDLTDPAEVKRFVAEGARYLGGIDIAVLNAAIPADSLSDTQADDIPYIVDTNLTAYMTAAKAALEHLGPGSDVVIIGSMSAQSRGGESTVYAATKTGVQAFAEALRKELAEKDIKVGNIEPGLTGSDMQLPDIPPEKQREMIHKGDMLRAEDIAAATHFMLTQPRRTAVSLMRVEPRLQTR